MAKTNDHTFTDKLGVPWQVVREDVVDPNPGVFSVPGVAKVRRYWAKAPYYYSSGPGRASMVAKDALIMGPANSVSEVDTWIADWVYAYRVKAGDLAPAPAEPEGGGFIVVAILVLLVLSGKR